ncbi:MAG: DEAD/DEAH box helicase [Gammaproteobacteria bacterium]|nr:DEAD/DEAH box helicase [Gammaproteobacteria bacterium]
MSDIPVITFAQLGLAAPVLQAVAEVGYETPSPIQAESIPPLLAGHDLLGMAQTGTGKTAAFALPLLSRLDLDLKQPQLLVLTPTRELAIQVAEAMQTYARHLPGFHILPVYGGQGMDVQLRQLRRGVHVVVGTPGRIQDHLRRASLKLDQLRAVVLDEADEMLRMGFIDDVELILEHTPAQKQVALFSATMPEAIKRVARNHLREPVEIRIQSKTTTVATIQQRYWQVSGVHKLDALTRILEVEDFDGIIIFVRTKNITVELAEKLEARGYSASPLNGDMNQQLREKTVDRLKRGSLDIVVATDVAARGLDVERISHVINYDIPYDTEAYVHRIGRTGRAGRKGEAILFVAPREQRMLRAIEKATGQKITPMQLPSREAITDRRVMAFKQLISDTLAAEDLDYFETLIEAYQAEHNVGLAEVAAALAYLVQRERPLLAQATKDDRKTEEQFKPETAATNKSAPRREESRKEHHKEPRKEPRKQKLSMPEEDMVRYRIEVGREHGVQPKNIVGAIANEAGIDSAYIGQINIFDDFSTVDLPDGMPREIFKHLKKVWVSNRQLNISLFEPGEPVRRQEKDKGRPGKEKTRKAKPATAKPKKPKAKTRHRKDAD